MKLPDKIKVGSMEYTVSFPKSFPTAPEHQGMFKNHSSSIEIVDTGNPPINWKIFMHELTHALDIVFCGCMFNEFETEVISNCIISLVVDNNSLFTSAKLPKKVRMLGWVYQVIEKYDFTESMNTASYMDHEHGNIYFADPKINNFSPQFVQMQLLLNCIKIIPINIFGSCYTFENFVHEDFPVSQLANGLLEVFAASNLEKSLKEVFSR